MPRAPSSSTSPTPSQTAAADRRRAKKREISRERIGHVRDYLREHPCVDCLETDIEVLEFDHVKGKKKAKVTALAHSGYDWSTIEREIRKCQVRCGNCHKRRHHRVQEVETLNEQYKNQNSPTPLPPPKVVKP